MGLERIPPVLLSRLGKKDSRAIATYVADGGYASWKKVLAGVKGGEWTPVKLTDAVKASGLRGRGGAGFPCGMKWTFVPPKEKRGNKPVYLLCNADESEPGTFKDRLLIENDPHQILEGMMLSSFALEVKHAYIYIRGEMVGGAEILNAAVAEAHDAGFHVGISPNDPEVIRIQFFEPPGVEMSAAMQKEVEKHFTRGELRRGILELPQETADSAAQMRRVIVDQIEALAELNRIVARHGRGLDAVAPAPRNERVAVTAPIRHEPLPRSEPARTEPLPRPSTRATDVASFAPTQRRASSPAPAPETPAPPAGKSWLSELLNRASRDEDEPLSRERAHGPARPEPESRGSDERTARHSIESLDSLSVDIARMIDHDAAIDLWDRYKRGERNVFTRRLYTLQGQQAFEEIRKKYRSDRDFKQTVDRYLGEFERLLDDVSRDDRGQMVARTYLTSDTGKVYTMLAHAAGRFD